MKLIIALLFIAYTANCQKAIGLEECIELAFTKNPSIALQNLNIQKATDTYLFSKRNQYPTVSGNLSQGLNGGRSIDPFSNAFIQRSISSNSFSVGASWNVFNGFTNKNLIETNMMGIEIEKSQMLLSKKDLKLGVIQAYMQVLINQELLNLAKEQSKDLEAQLLILKEKVSEGLVANYMIVELEAQLANTKYEIYNANNNIVLAKLELGQWLGFENKNDFELKPLIVKTNTIGNDINRHPSLKMMQTQLAIAKINTKTAMAAKYPSVNLGAGLGSAYSSAASDEFNYFRQVAFNFNQNFRLGVSIPIFSNGQIASKISNSEIQERIILKQIEQQKLKVNQEVEKQKLAIALLEEKLTFGKVNYAMQQKTYEAAKGRFAEGLISISELNTFRLNAEKAKIVILQTEIEASFKVLALEVFME